MEWGDAMVAPVTTIVPDPTQLHLLHLSAIHLSAPATESTAVVQTGAARASCPLCGRCSSRVHSRSVRAVAEVPWHGVPFPLRLQVQHCVCDEPTCSRAIVAARLPGLVAPHARRTARLAVWLRAADFAVGGAAGARRLRVFLGQRLEDGDEALVGHVVVSVIPATCIVELLVGSLHTPRRRKDFRAHQGAW